MTTSPGSRALTALVTGVTTAAYYAVPDVAHSRAARGWLKTACLVAGSFTMSPRLSGDTVRELRSSWHERTGLDTADGTAEPTSAAERWSAASPRQKAVIAGTGAALVAASTALTVAGEKWLFRRGEARAAAGVRFPHTRTGLVLGALSAALALVPDPSERR